MDAYLIDINVFLRIFSGLDEEHKSECLMLLRMIEKGVIKAVVSNLVLSEMVWTLGSYYKHSRREIVMAVRSVVNINKLNFFDDYDTYTALDMFEKKSIKFIDALIASVPQIQSGKWAIVSYDKDFDKVGVKRLEPSDIISRG